MVLTTGDFVLALSWAVLAVHVAVRMCGSLAVHKRFKILSEANELSSVAVFYKCTQLILQECLHQIYEISYTSTSDRQYNVVISLL